MSQPAAAQMHVDGYGASASRKRNRKAKQRKLKLIKADTRPFDGNPDAYSESEWQQACIVDRGDTVSDVKKRYAVPVREPDGALHETALLAAADTIRKSDLPERSKDKAHSKLAKRCAKAGMPARLIKASLSGKQRDKLPDSDFIFPKTREYPYPDEQHAKNALSRGAQNETGKRLATIRSKIKAGYPNIDVTKADLELQVPLWKDDAKRLVYGVVLSPGLRDSQGDISDADDIEKAAHRFLVEYRKHDVQHADTEADVETVESFLAPQDMDIAGQHVLKGAWVMVTHVTDPEIWERVQKGEITGYSIGGTGQRLPDAA